MPLSKLTVASLADRGYVVNMAMVSPDRIDRVDDLYSGADETTRLCRQDTYYLLPQYRK